MRLWCYNWTSPKLLTQYRLSCTKWVLGLKCPNVILLLAAYAQSFISIMAGYQNQYTSLDLSDRAALLSPLLFALVTHPLLWVHERYAQDGTLHGVRIKNKNMFWYGLLLMTFSCFWKHAKFNVATYMIVLNMYAHVAGLLLNVFKSLAWQDTPMRPYF